MQLILLSTAILAGLQTVSAHGSIKQPKPILFDEMRDTYNAPLKPDYSDFPCKGYHNQPFSAAETWKAGQEASFVIDMSHIAAHGGGSCQASISHDGGKSFQVLHSFIGDCPRAANGNSAGDAQEFKFMIPSDEPAGDAIFAWTWFAAIANREMYMNCAYVTIENSNPSSTPAARPNMFVGLLAPGACKVNEQTNLDFPEPGPAVTDGSNNPTAEYKGKTKPSGTDCGHEETGGGESILSSLPPNSAIVGGGSGSGGSPVAGPKPGPVLPSQVVDPAETSTIVSTTMVTSVMTSTMIATVTTPAPKNVVYVTQLVTNAVVDVVYITQTSYVPGSPTPNAVRRSEPVVARDEACDFQETLKIGSECPVPTIQSSTWKSCVWTQFCGCLDDNLSPIDIINFAQIKNHCDCVTKDIGCPAIPRTRHRKRHAHIVAMDIILPRDNNAIKFVEA
ncbi:hypothetical protein ABW20_dc0101454 [Dactylellina cionopaga]|nr:hypothetical protein ABW20_dc0101454 [Dactylellina cionopaga]